MSVNCYVGAVAVSEDEARTIVQEKFFEPAQKLVHMEPPTDPEELPTWIFEFWADSSEQEEGDYLHDLYTLPQLENMPCEIA